METPEESGASQAEMIAVGAGERGSSGVRLTASERWMFAVIALAAWCVVGVSIWLRPDPTGMGTHQQLGRLHKSLGSPCGLLLTTRLPCPSCGMTTAFAYTVRGRLVSAFIAQPAGLVLALATIVAGVATGYGAISGRPPRLPWKWMTPYRLFMGLLIVLVGGWGWKLAYGFATGALPVKSSEVYRVAG